MKRIAAVLIVALTLGACEELWMTNGAAINELIDSRESLEGIEVYIGRCIDDMQRTNTYKTDDCNVSRYMFSSWESVHQKQSKIAVKRLKGFNGIERYPRDVLRSFLIAYQRVYEKNKIRESMREEIKVARK